MSTRTDWGYFDKGGTPLAVGDTHAKWECPNKKWVTDDTYTHPYTGETELVEPYTEPCRFIATAFAKVDRCPRCGVQFRYP